MIKCVFLGVGLTVFVAGSAWANGPSSYVTEIQTCGEIEDDMARLSCYDKIADLSANASPSTEAVKVVPSPEPEFAALKPKRDKEAEKARYFDVRSVSKGSSGLIVTLENGQVWRQKNGSAGQIPKGKLVARIKPASFGSYFLTLRNEDGKTGRKGVRFKRVK